MFYLEHLTVTTQLSHQCLTTRDLLLRSLGPYQIIKFVLLTVYICAHALNLTRTHVYCHVHCIEL